MPEVPSEAIQAKAAKLLLARCVVVKFCERTDDGRGHFDADVKPLDGGDPYHVRFNEAGWHCDCIARVQVCAHVLACQTITDDMKIPVVPDVVDPVDIDKLLGM